jgi:hypothetical protein
MRRRNNASNDILRLIGFVVGIFCGVYVINAIHERKLDVGMTMGKYVVIDQASDPDVFWGIVIFVAVVGAAVLFAAIFGKDRPHA